MIPKVFEHIVKVVASDIDELNHVNNVVYFNYLQQAAMAHWYSNVPTELSDSMRWVVKKHEIEYFKPAVLNDQIIVKTWVENFSGVTSDRHYEIYKNEILLVKARTLWVALDPVSMRPKRVPADLWECYFAK
ncbi:acyl-CoA thioesterase [Lacihabitans sp. LS3-19]|uniref:acyl-CoA thioesterase n=1 Tax=Lacihabitans sp. LS3-19 TaxID=2487335 RepID=UPI0020CDCBAD|nr:thioesterase family protein [Lacihabitans sp. LS3-19]MCP9768824.1 acyl-CoA thioesterase [Lacihabitans sp. LS3-19]